MPPAETQNDAENPYTLAGITADVSADLGEDFVRDHAELVRGEIQATLLVFAEFGPENVAQSYADRTESLLQREQIVRGMDDANQGDAERSNTHRRVVHAVYRSFMRRFEASQSRKPEIAA